MPSPDMSDPGLPGPGGPSPALPAAPPLTSAAAARWRAARTSWPPERRRLDSRLLALVPVAFIVLATALEPVASACTAAQPCVQSWSSALATFSVFAEVVLLLARPRGLALVPVAVAAGLWYLPGGLENEVCRWTALACQGFLALVLIGAELGRRRARHQLDVLMGTPEPYPWTLAGVPSPVPPPARRGGRRLLGRLLVAAGVLLALTGLVRQAQSDHRADGAARVPGTVLSVDEPSGTARIGYRLPAGDAARAEAAAGDAGRSAGGRPDREFEADVLWSPLPVAGEAVPLLVDGEDWVRIEGQPYDPTDLAFAGALPALLGALLLGSASRWVRIRRGLGEPCAPALAVLVQPDGKGSLLVGPVDGDGTGEGRPLWRLRAAESYAWSERRGWREDEPRDGGDDEDGEKYDEYEEEYPQEPGEQVPAALPEHAAAVFEAVNRPVPAVLYRGPDGPYAQLLVRPGMAPDGPEPGWLAVVCREGVLAPRRGPRHRHYLEDELAVPALAARTIAAAPADGPPLPAQRWEMPLALRLAAGPLVALAMAALVDLLGSRSWGTGLVHPLLAGIPVFLAAAGALTWQAAIDGRGVAVVSGMTRRFVPWDQVNAAAVHRHRLAVQLTDGRELRIGSRPARLLSRHLGGPYDPEAVATAIATAAHRPARRPGAALRERLVSPQLLVNRAALTGYIVFVIARFAF
ncbi:hypothetical protein GCM10010495_74820 [Kitasatospora herbaricolor]|uniref:hypothetical protein n=1 Tax=Kitasatospora herbaricolor TaxID=68217 RepID=UPI00174C55F9|nr:hypothetical protein [Kitasatospora herbaricolor]MDQ0308672.1 hypothetical protein [Kitasatospora herbaricolor]GGV46299.1 hypothetical protein GCM10010495_74820 [Kitasatospora herbaricolor]